MTARLTPLALASFSTAAIWPWVVSAISAAMLSPVERISRSAWCGAPFHGAVSLLGHCPACWAGSALLALTGILLLLVPDATAAGVIARVKHHRGRYGG